MQYVIYMQWLTFDLRCESGKYIYIYIYISRRMIVCRAAQEEAHHTVGILTGRNKTSFSHFCISVIPYPTGTKFATQFPASQ